MFNNKRIMIIIGKRKGVIVPKTKNSIPFDFI